MPKYNIVLTIEDSNINELLNEFAQTLQTKVVGHKEKDQYLIEANKSIAHISLYQIDEENELSYDKKQSIISAINKIVLDVCSLLNVHNITGELGKVSYKTDKNGIFAGTTWVQIDIDKEENLMIKCMHLALYKELNDKFKCKNAHQDNYSPHLTLFNTKTSFNLLKTNEINTTPLPDVVKNKRLSFQISLGKANDQWELVEKGDIVKPASAMLYEYGRVFGSNALDEGKSQDTAAMNQVLKSKL